MHYAVDTNVLVAANGRDTHADIDCRLKAVEWLELILADSSLLLDMGLEVLTEYYAYCNFAGQPGLGDEFFRWAFQSQGLLSSIELHPHETRRYVEFPDSAGLEEFDPPDRKFVALAFTHSDAAVVNCLDSDYDEAGAALSAAGVQVIELCPHQLHTAD